MGIRTTVTLDEDVLEKLKQESRARGLPVRQILNDSLRNALLTPKAEAKKREFHITPFLSGVRQDLNFDDVPRLFEYLDGPGYK